MAAGCKATCRREPPDNLMVSDKILRKEKHDEHISAYCEGSDDGSHRGPPRRAIRRGGARRTILGAENDEPRPILETVNGQPRPIFRADNNDPGPIRGTDNHHPGFWIDQDGSSHAWAVAWETLDETVRRHTGAEAIPSRCNGPGRPRFQNPPFDPAGQHE